MLRSTSLGLRVGEFCVAGIFGLALASPTLAETRTFVIANSADTYGVDRCLLSNERCGSVVATAYCQAKQFDQATSYRKVAREEITRSIDSDASCRGGICPDLVAIECTR